MLTYEDFYHKIWGHYITELDVSFEYREKNSEFIKQITFIAWNKFQSKNVHESVYAEMFKVFFSNLFLYKPDVFDEFVD